MAHHPPPVLRDHLNSANTAVDWAAVRKECSAVEAKIDKDFAEGRMTKDNHDFFVLTINKWLNVMVKAWPAGGNPVRTPYAVNIEQGIRDDLKKLAKKRGSHDPNHTSYKKGKWSDL
jgi:hypothetical protein